LKFKVDENLPAEAADILRDSGFIADTVADEDLSGADDDTVASASKSDLRILVTLDLDFANIRAYPPGEHAGIIVLRVRVRISPLYWRSYGGLQPLCRIGIRAVSCGLLTAIGFAFDKAIDRPAL